ncbi:MAG TPA: HAD-IC family P-type ATPase, partial [Thermoanaerobaculia bacterium]|nr:HAD-IC family P-type ATPase [Thermoanaerobaculia bacterium]
TSAEQRLEHPIARALRERAAQSGLVLPAVDASSYRVGLGILVRIAGEPVRLGSVRFMAREAIPIPPEVGAEVAAVHEAGHSALLLAVGARLVGLIEIRASTRPEAARVVDRLRSRWGIREIHLLSGDHEAATRSFAEKLGISRYLSEVLPQEKAEYVRQLQLAGRKVVMVGDGVNDAIALSQADCSVSFHGAADVATDVADMVLMDGDLDKLDLILDLSAQLDTNIRRSFGLILVANSVCIAGALLGFFGIGTSLVLNNVFNLASALNGLLPFYQLSSEIEREEAGRTAPP